MEGKDHLCLKGMKGIIKEKMDFTVLTCLQCLMLKYSQNYKEVLKTGKTHLSQM